MIASFIVPSFKDFHHGPTLGAISGLGAALVILVPGAKLSEVLLSAQPVRWIGKISYSLYLVHWPLWIFAPEFLKDGPWDWIPLILLSIALTIPLHYFIENPLRHGALAKWLKLPKAGDLWIFGASALSVVAAGFFIATQDKLPGRQSATLSASQIDDGIKARLGVPSCGIAVLSSDACDLSKPVQILFFGNSHEPDGFNSFHHLYDGHKDVNLIRFGTGNGCDMQVVNNFVTSNVTARQCKKRFSQLNNLLTDGKLTHIVFTANIPFAPNKKLLWSALNDMHTADNSLNFIVMGGFLNTTENCSAIINRDGGFSSCFSSQYKKYFPRTECQVFEPEIDFEYLYIDRIRMMCGKAKQLENCVSEGYGEPAFYDQHHMSLGYAKRIGDVLKQRRSKQLKAIGILDVENR